MKYALEYLTTALKRAREAKQLSQRALSQKVGTPQARISRIENGAVDLKTSSLIELARVLDLEVMLVPRRHVPAVTALTRHFEATADAPAQRPAYTLDDGDGDE